MTKSLATKKNPSEMLKCIFSTSSTSKEAGHPSAHDFRTTVAAYYTPQKFRQPVLKFTLQPICAKCCLNLVQTVNKKGLFFQ